MTNPLLEEWTTPFGIAPFDRLDEAHFEPAFDIALDAARKEIEEIADNAAPASFANTIEALEASGEALDKVVSVFFTVAAADSTPKRQELQRLFGPKLAAYSSEVTGNAKLFARIEALWQARDDLGLSDEQARLLMLTRRRFVRAGAALDGEAAQRMREIMARLAELGTRFAQNLLADEAGWTMELDEPDLENLPDFVISAARQAGRDSGHARPVITLSRSLIVPFLQFSPRRDLRERAFRAWAARGANGGKTDNRAIAAEILTLRQERAALLGYDSFAAYKLETEMAGTPQRVKDLLWAVWRPAKRQAEADAAILTGLMRGDGVNDDLRPWDWRYYAEMRRQAEHDLDEAEVKPFLSLDNMIGAAFAVAGRLFGLQFTRLDIALHHPECRAWEVTRNGRHVGVFIGDYFARPSKRSGAWCSAMRGQAKWPRAQGPVVLNVCNFAQSDPALLSYDDARTLFHEFGHALHHLLSDVTYESLSGTSVARDFVELPSQLFEHWLEVPEVLEDHARHHQTGAPMPVDLLDKLLGAANFDQGFQTVEYVASAMVDLAFHEGDPPADPMERQRAILDDMGMPPAITMRHATPHFAHVFSGDGYSSGYYSYMWSEVMDADAFDAFREGDGPFDERQAEALERHILSRGGSADPEVLYRAFRGRLPGVEALLRERQLTG